MPLSVCDNTFLCTDHTSDCKITIANSTRKNKKSTIKLSDVEKIVRATIGRSIGKPELKYYMNWGANQSLVQTSGSPPSYINLVPSIATGTNVQSRIGNEIFVKSAKIRLAANLLPYNSISNPLITPLYVRVLICSNRTLNTTSLASTNVASSLFLLGTNPVGTQGNMLDITAPVNWDAWSVMYDKTFRLGITNASATGPASTGGWYDSSAMSFIEEIDLTSMLGGLKYANNSNDPYNKNLFLIMLPANADGTSGPGYVPAEYHFAFQTRFTDI